MISKSDYTAALQCPRMLWLRKNMPEAADASAQAVELGGGIEVGGIARGYHRGGYVLIGNDFDYERMAGETSAALDVGETVCEATFVAGDLVCLADIVRPLPDGSLELTEVKSTTGVKPHQVDDVAFQAHVMGLAGRAPGKINLMHVNGDYVRGGALDARRFLSIEGVMPEVERRRALVEDVVAVARAVAAAPDEPDVGIGPHCNTPHPCPFQGRCWAHVPENSVFDMAGMGRKRGWKWWDKGIRTADDVARAMRDGDMKPNMLRSRQCSGEVHADAAALSRFLSSNVRWPVYHLDFETFQTAVPRYPGTKPYQQVPSQFSIHVQDAPGRWSRHIEFLAEAGPDPRRAVAEALIDAIPEGACVAAYNMSFEKGRIKEMADACPDLAPRLLSIRDSIIDLMVPFQKGMLYRPEMGASYSIKAVLPAFYPDDPELDYHALPTVHNGAEAAAAFLALEELEGDELAVSRNGLLRYCELDTLAMVKVLDAVVAHAG